MGWSKVLLRLEESAIATLVSGYANLSGGGLDCSPHWTRPASGYAGCWVEKGLEGSYSDPKTAAALDGVFEDKN
jgi:hypothetical protein